MMPATKNCSQKLQYDNQVNLEEKSWQSHPLLFISFPFISFLIVQLKLICDIKCRGNYFIEIHVSDLTLLGALPGPESNIY